MFLHSDNNRHSIHRVFGISLLLLLTLILGVRTIAYAGDQPPQSLDGDALHRLKTAASLPGAPPPDVSPKLRAELTSVAPAAADKPAYNEQAWTRVVAGAPLDTGWEIVALQTDGSGMVRLTNDTATDLRPSLDRNGGQVVFSSDRTGNRELFLINVDGSNLRQITNHPGADDYARFFSLSERIVFASDRGGSWDIYVTNSDGSGVSQLTNDANALDFYPAVSADDSQIAWIKVLNPSSQTPTWQLWLMNADGTNQRATSLSCNYMQHVYWMTPTLVLVDCDVTADYFNDVITYNVDTGVQYTKYNSNFRYYTDGWAGAALGIPSEDTFVNPYGAVFIQYRVVNNRLQIERFYSELYIDNWSKTSLDNLLINAWQKTDWDPPVTWLRIPSSVYVSAGSFRPFLDFGGRDVGAAGLNYYELEYRRNNGDWSVAGRVDPGYWDENALSYDKVGYGDTVDLRAYGVDNAGNRESLDSKTPQTIRYFRGQLDATVVDFAGFPVAMATVESANVAADSNTTSANGRYTGYIIQDMPVQITVTHPAFQTNALSTTLKPYDVYSDITVIILPSENLLQDGSFEQSALVDWTADPAEDVLLTEQAAASGNQGLMLGQAANFLKNVTRMTGPNDSPISLSGYDLALDANGNLHLLMKGPRYQKCQGTTCDPVEEIMPSSGNTNIYGAVMAVGGGRVVVAWRESQGATIALRFADRSNGLWPSQVIASAPSMDVGPAMAVDSQGYAHVAWLEAAPDPQTGIFISTLKYRRQSASGWGAEEAIVSGYQVNNLQLVLDGADNPHIFYSFDNLYHSERSGQDSWSQPEVVDASFAYGNDFDVAIDSNDTIQLVMKKAVTFYKYKQNGTWSDQEYVAENPVQSSGSSVQLEALDDGRLVMENGDGRLYIRSTSGVWTGPHFAGPSSFGEVQDVLMASGPGARLALLPLEVVISPDSWYEDRAIYGYQFVLPSGETSRRSSISRHFTIPMTLTNPVLQLPLRFKSEDATKNQDRFLVEIDDGVAVTRVETITVPSDTWTNNVIRLYPWSGKEITLTLSVDATADETLSWVFMDDLRLTTWTTPRITDVAVKTASSARAKLPYGVAGTLIITGENFIEMPSVYIDDTPADAVRFVSSEMVEADVPANLTAAMHDVVVTNPGGVSAVRSGALAVGEQIYLPYIRR